MINLKTEEFVLDMNTLQALQQLLQWVGDFVLYLLTSLPNQVPARPCWRAAHSPLAILYSLSCSPGLPQLGSAPTAPGAPPVMV